MVEGMLYRVTSDGSLCTVPPTEDRHCLFQEAHEAKFGGHLGDAKVFGTLARHYWWPKMQGDISSWCQVCIVCATHHVGWAIKPLLAPTPVVGPFDCVDVLQLPVSEKGKKYAIVFMNYLTKWPEVFIAKDQSAHTIAKFSLEQIITRHGVPTKLSDRGASFFSKLLQEVYSVMGIHKANSIAYHPQTGGLVEGFNLTLLAMLSKTVESGGRDWDERLPFILFAYRANPQQ